MMPNEEETGSSEKFSISRNQIVVLGLVLILIGVLISGRQFGWFNEQLRHEPISIPSGAPYAEATVIGAYDGVVLAERVATVDAQGNVLQKKLEILTDGKTVFAKITSSGPVKIPWSELSEGDVIWVHNRVRTLEETLAEPADPELAIPFEDMVKNPRERIIAEYIVIISGENK